MNNAKIIVTVPHDPEEVKRNGLLQRLKEQYHTDYMPRTRLYEMTSLRGNKLPEPRLFWLSRVDMAGRSYADVSSEDVQAAHSLLEKGYLMRTFSISTLGGPTVRQIKLIEDAQWGIDEQDNMYIFDLAKTDIGRDDILKLGKEYTAAINAMNHRIEFGAAFIHSSKIKLSDGTALSPIIHDPKMAGIHLRQIAFQR